jgi:large subunit ribosomal protein L12e
LGLPAKKVQEDIAKATIEYKGLRVSVKLLVQNRQATIELCPSTAVQIIKALKEPPRDRKKEKKIKHHGSLTLDQIITIARGIRSRSFAKNLRGTVREVLGTCSSMGCRVEGENAHDISAKVLSGEISIPEK